MKINPVKCPKCKNAKLELIEHIVVPEVMYQNVNGETTFFTGVTGGFCYVVKWVASCLKCQHTWQLKRKPAVPSTHIPTYTSEEEIDKWLNGEAVSWARNMEVSNEKENSDSDSQQGED
jgi:hypothetical protein